MLLAKYIDIRHVTSDIDLLIIRIKSHQEKIIAIIQEVIAVDTEDGFQFFWQVLVFEINSWMHFSRMQLNYCAKETDKTEAKS